MAMEQVWYGESWNSQAGENHQVKKSLAHIFCGQAALFFGGELDMRRKRGNW
jgi:hypothetical protein